MIYDAGYKPRSFQPDLRTTMTHVDWLAWSDSAAVGRGITKTCAPGGVDCKSTRQQIAYSAPRRVCGQRTFTRFHFSKWRGRGHLEQLLPDQCQWYFEPASNQPKYSLDHPVDDPAHPPAFHSFAVPRLGSSYGMVVIALFISATHIVVIGKGDDRGFASNGRPPPDKVRVAFTLDFATGRGRMRVNPTCAEGPAGCGGPNPIVEFGHPFPFGDAARTARNDIYTTAGNGKLAIWLGASNGAAAPYGAWLLGEIDAVIAIKAEARGNLKAVFTLKAFPSTEAYQLVGRKTRTLVRVREQRWKPSEPLDRDPDTSALQKNDSKSYVVCTDRAYCK